MANYHYSSLFGIDNPDYSVPLVPVNIGQTFSFFNYKCEVTKLCDNYFEYEFVNPSRRNDRISSKRITYKYWQEILSKKQR